MRKFSLPFKIIVFYILLNLTIVIPLNKFIYNNIDKFYTIFKDEQRLYYYDKMPDLTMKAHWINKYYKTNDFTIIMVGDSKVEDFYVKYEDSIAAKLDRKLFGEKDTPFIFNFGSSGTKTVYVMERIKKAAEYNPDLIIWQMGSGTYPSVNWVFPPSSKSYDLSLGGDLAGAYANIFKLNDQNAPFISAELRSNLIPLSRYSTFFVEYFKGLKSKFRGTPLAYPNDPYLAITEGSVPLPVFTEQTPFDASTRNFDAIGYICKYVYEKGIPMMIYIDPIRQTVAQQKFEEGYYEKLIDAIKKEASPYGVPVLDLHTSVPDELFIDGGHVKERGNEIVAQKLYEFILENFNNLFQRGLANE